MKETRRSAHQSMMNGLGNDNTPCLPLDCWPRWAEDDGPARPALDSIRPPYLPVAYYAKFVSSPGALARQLPRPERHLAHWK